MYFSASTVALIATSMGMIGMIEASPLVERANSLCNKPNYGAQGYPWQSDSTPGSFCSNKKPSNSGAWAQIPYSDGYDKVKCSNPANKNLAICKSGNPAAQLPSGCQPPKWGWMPNGGGKFTIPQPGPTPPAGSGPKGPAGPGLPGFPALPSLPALPQGGLGGIFGPGGVFGPGGPFAPAPGNNGPGAPPAPCASSAKANVPSAVSSAQNVVSSVVSSVTPSATSSVTSSTTPAPVASSTTTSTTASSTTSAGLPIPTNPVCELTYQVTYLNYTMVAPNGVWTGMTVGSAAQDASYMTYTLATTVDDCLAACDAIAGCAFVNTYYDVNETEEDLPKHTPGVLTCAMFSSCVPTSNNNNWGGQDDPNTIVQSNGYCKSGLCTGTS